MYYLDVVPWGYKRILLQGTIM